MSEYLAENSRLRQLSRRYADGQMAFEEYRSARREILEALEEGKTQSAGLPPLDDVTSPATAAVGDSTEVRLADDSTVFYKTMPPRVPVEDIAAAAVPPAPVASWDSNTRMLAAVLGVSLLIALGALIYVFVL